MGPSNFFSIRKLILYFAAVASLLWMWILMSHNDKHTEEKPYIRTPLIIREPNVGVEVPVKLRRKVAYAITVTKDGPFLDGALVLGYSIKKVHSEKNSDFDADLVAFVLPEIVIAKEMLTKFGWKVLVKDLPVPLEEIENKEYVEKVRNFTENCFICLDEGQWMLRSE